MGLGGRVHLSRDVFIVTGLDLCNLRLSTINFLSPSSGRRLLDEEQLQMVNGRYGYANNTTNRWLHYQGMFYLDISQNAIFYSNDA